MPVPSSEAEDAIRYRASRGRGHVESHFVKATSPDGRRAVWIKHTLLARPGGGGVAEVWAVASERGRGPVAFAKSTHPIDEARIAARPFQLEVDGSTCEAFRIEGSVEGAAHSLSYRLALDPRAAPYRPYPLDLMYRSALPRGKTMTPCPSARVDGEVRVDGARWPVEGWDGMRGHNWGTAHQSHYAWAHASAFRDVEDAWLELVTGRVRVAGVLLPWLTVAAVQVEGRLHRFDTLVALTSRRVDVRKHALRATLSARGATLDLEVFAVEDEMVALRYESPDGSVTRCRNTKLAGGRATLARPGEPPLVLVTDRMALEIGSPGSATDAATHL